MRRLAKVRFETRALLTWLALAVALWIFFALGDEIAEGDTSLFDTGLIGLLRASGGEPVGPSWFNNAMRDVTALGSVTFLTLVTVVAVLALLFHRKRREALTLAATAISAQASIEILKSLYDRPRPQLLPAAAHAFTKSFPSGHTTESTAVFLTLATVIASLEPARSSKVLAYAVAIFVIAGIGFSRVYLGMHWPTDVLGGWVLGTAWATVAWVALRKSKSR